MLKINISKNIKSVKGNSALNVNVEFNASVITGIFGNSGEGKSTLLNIISGVINAELGKIIFNDKIWFDSDSKQYLKTQHRNLSYIFQQNSLFPHFTVEENILYAVKKNAKVDINALLEMVEMPNMKNSYPHQLSGGQIQRVAIARALAQNANIILMDEPFSALDLEIKQKLYTLIKEFKVKYNLMILIVTHDINDIYYLCDEVIWINNHHVSEILSKENFKNKIEFKLKNI